MASSSIEVRGVVQGVGFRPFIYRLARAHGLTGWVLNHAEGVVIHAEGERDALHLFASEIESQAPQAALISEILIRDAQLEHSAEFVIRDSAACEKPTVRISPDLPVCPECSKELFDSRDPRYRYPYINCTNCGPRYTVIRRLPYDRSNTTMDAWPLDELCRAEYDEPANRRFHAQPVACPACGPHYYFQAGAETIRDDGMAVYKAAECLRDGKILAIKGLGGYHLACDARNASGVLALRTRKYRKEKPFALMAKNIEFAHELVHLSADAESLMNSVARPIVLSPAKVQLAEVAPDNDELGVMLPFTPLHLLLFEAGAPEVLVMTSANRSSEPIAYQDEEALHQLAPIADGFLIGERPIERRVDDSVARVGAFGPAILRRARGYAPGAATRLPAGVPMLALGADLKNAVTLVVDGQAFVSQHIGDLDHYEAFCGFRETVHDLLAMYEVDPAELTVVHDAHPEYASSVFGQEFAAARKVPIQHHRAHIASVLAERQEWDRRIIGVAFDGTGYGDDGTIWGGEFFAGSLRQGLTRVAHLRAAALAGGDAAATHPVQAAAGFLTQLTELPDFHDTPFSFPARYFGAQKLIRSDVRSFSTTSMGRLFDTAAALLGFTREITFEGQAAMWLERLASMHSGHASAHPFPFSGDELDFRALLAAVVSDRQQGCTLSEIARRFQLGVASGLCSAVRQLCGRFETKTVVLSGGVFQNEMLLRDVTQLLAADRLQIWTNHIVPANDGGISLGQAALAALSEGIADA
jgi:hydrogenase maturation protein HypF